jgi:hypothetical protein
MNPDPIYLRPKLAGRRSSHRVLRAGIWKSQPDLPAHTGWHSWMIIPLYRATISPGSLR